MIDRERKRERERAYYAAHKEAICARRRAKWGDHHRARNRAYVRKNKERVAEYHAAFRYKITREQLRALRAEFPACAICGGDNNGAALVIDHDHQSGDVRGLLCKLCNWGIGHFRENQALLYKAAMYLARYQKIGAVS